MDLLAHAITAALAIACSLALVPLVFSVRLRRMSRSLTIVPRPFRKDGEFLTSYRDLPVRSRLQADGTEDPRDARIRAKITAWREASRRLDE